MSSRGLNTNQIGLVSGFGNSDPKDSNHMRFQIGSVWIRMEGSFMYSEPLGLSEKILYTNRRARFGWWFGAIPSFFGFRSLEAENIFRWGWVFDEMMTRWWFQICVMFTCSWGHDPIWRPHIFQMGCSHRLRINPNTRENEKRNERLELWQRWCVIFLGQRDLASRPSKHGLWQIFQSEPGQRDLASRPSKHGLWQIFQSEPGQRDLASRPSKHGLWQIFQSEPGQRDLASRPSKHGLWQIFQIQNLDNVTWPAGLQSMAFGKFFNQNLDNVTWPAGLQRLLFWGTAKVCKAQMRCQGHWVTWRLESCRGKVEKAAAKEGSKKVRVFFHTYYTPED